MKKIIFIVMLWQMVSMNIHAAGIAELTSALKVLQSKLVTLSALLQGSQDGDLKKLAEEIVDEYIKSNKENNIPLYSHYSLNGPCHFFDDDDDNAKKEEVSRTLFKIMRGIKRYPYFSDPSQLKTFTAYSSGRLETEYLVLKALHRIGFTDIKTINIADLEYKKKDIPSASEPGMPKSEEFKSYEFCKNAVEWFKTEVKKLFPDCSVNDYDSNEAHRKACAENKTPKSDFVVMSAAWGAVVDDSCAHDRTLVAIIWEPDVFMIKWSDCEKVPLTAENLWFSPLIDQRYKEQFESSDMKVIDPGYLGHYTLLLKFKERYPKLLHYPDITSNIDAHEESFAPIIKKLGEIYSNYRLERDFVKRAELLQQLVDTAKAEGKKIDRIDHITEDEKLAPLIIRLANKQPVSIDDNEYKEIELILNVWKENGNAYYLYNVQDVLADFIDFDGHEDRQHFVSDEKIRAMIRVMVDEVTYKKPILTDKFKSNFIAWVQWVHDHLKKRKQLLLNPSTLLQGSQDGDGPLKKLAEDVLEEYEKQEKSGSPIGISLPVDQRYWDDDEPSRSETKKEVSNYLVKIMRATKQHFKKSSDLRTFTAYSAGGLETEFLILKTLHRIGFKDIKIINVADHSFKKDEEKKDDFFYKTAQQAIEFLKTDAKTLFPGCAVNVYESNGDHRKACKTDESLKSNFVVMSYAWSAIIDDSCADKNALAVVKWDHLYMVKWADFENDKISLNAEVFRHSTAADHLKQALAAPTKSLSLYGLDDYVRFIKCKEDKNYSKLIKHPDIKSCLEAYEKVAVHIQKTGDAYRKYRDEHDFEKRAQLLKKMKEAVLTDGVQIDENIDKYEELVKLIITLAKKKNVAISDNEYAKLIDFASIRYALFEVNHLLQAFFGVGYDPDTGSLLSVLADVYNTEPTKPIFTEEFKEKFIALIRVLHDRLKKNN